MTALLVEGDQGAAISDVCYLVSWVLDVLPRVLDMREQVVSFPQVSWVSVTANGQGQEAGEHRMASSIHFPHQPGRGVAGQVSLV